MQIGWCIKCVVNSSGRVNINALGRNSTYVLMLFNYKFLIYNVNLFELFYQEAEVREARKLKSSHENTMLLKEKLFEEQRRRERAESELLKIPELQLSMKTLEDELTSWKSMIKHIPDVSCSDDIPLKFAGLQK